MQSWHIATLIWLGAVLITFIVFSFIAHEPITTKEDIKDPIGAGFALLEGMMMGFEVMLMWAAILFETLLYAGWWIYHLAVT